MALMRSKMRTVESTTVSAMRSTRRELAKVATAIGKQLRASAWRASSSRWSMGDGGLGERRARSSRLGDVVSVEPAR